MAQDGAQRSLQPLSSRMGRIMSEVAPCGVH